MGVNKSPLALNLKRKKNVWRSLDIPILVHVSRLAGGACGRNFYSHLRELDPCIISDCERSDHTGAQTDGAMLVLHAFLGGALMICTSRPCAALQLHHEQQLMPALDPPQTGQTLHTWHGLKPMEVCCIQCCFTISNAMFLSFARGSPSAFRFNLTVTMQSM